MARERIETEDSSMSVSEAEKLLNTCVYGVTKEPELFIPVVASLVVKYRLQGLELALRYNKQLDRTPWVA